MGKKSRSQRTRGVGGERRRGESTTQAKEQVSNAARKAIRRDIPAINVLAKACDELQKEWRVFVSRGPWALVLAPGHPSKA